MRHIITLAILAIASTALADPPVAKVYGPTTGTPGELLTLDGSQSTGAKLFRWSCDVELKGKTVFEPMCENSAKIRICTIPGVYHYTLAVANDEGIDLLNWTVEIPGGPAPPTPPNPPPGPNPTPPPDPPNPSPPPPDPLPDGRFKISKDIAKWASQVSTSNLKAESDALAEACAGIRSQIMAGGLSGAQEILQALLAANRAALGKNLPNWTGFGQKLAARIAAIYQSGALGTKDDWATLLGEIELGFRHATDP